MVASVEQPAVVRMSAIIPKNAILRMALSCDDEDEEKRRRQPKTKQRDAPVGFHCYGAGKAFALAHGFASKQGHALATPLKSR